jgi:hypothetical protein
MHEHGREERRHIPDGIGVEAARDESPLPHERVTAALLYKEEQDVESDQGIRDERNSPARRIVVTDWKHAIYLLLPVGGMFHRNGVERDAGSQSAPPVSIA